MKDLEPKLKEVIANTICWANGEFTRLEKMISEYTEKVNKVWKFCRRSSLQFRTRGIPNRRTRE